MKTLLKYDSVEICYGKEIVIKDVSFSLAEGQILGIAGESGSGKSTLIKAAMGLLGSNAALTKGKIWFRNQNLSALSEKEMRKIRGKELGMIFQDTGASMCPVRTIGNQIYEGMASHIRVKKTEARKKALELFDRLEFQDGERIWNSYPFELSGGMSQRVGIAMAMLLNPAVLLADEPTSALDVSVQKLAVLEMMKLRELFGTAMIIVSHDIGMISAMTDMVLILENGEVREYGETSEVLLRPRHDYTKKLLDSVPRLKGVT